MSALTLDQAGTHTAHTRPGGGVGNLKVTWLRVLRGEWIKLRSLRSTWWSLSLTVVVMVGLTALTAQVISSMTPAEHQMMQQAASQSGASGGMRMSGVGVTQAGVQMAQLVVGVLGCLIITSEYSSGMIRSSLAAVRSRWSVLSAKAVVIGLTTLVISVPATLVSFFVGQGILGSAGVSISDAGVLRTLIGQAAYLTGVALLGMAIGALIRSTAGAIASLFGLLLVLPGVLQLVLSQVWVDRIVPYLPSQAGTSFASLTPQQGMLSAGKGAWVFAVWIVALLGLAAFSLQRRDA